MADVVVGVVGVGGGDAEGVFVGFEFAIEAVGKALCRAVGVLDVGRSTSGRVGFSGCCAVGVGDRGDLVEGVVSVGLCGGEGCCRPNLWWEGIFF